MSFSPYHCPKCGTAVVFKRMLTINEAAYYAGYSVATIRHEMSTGKLKFRYWLNHNRYWQVIDTIDMLQWMDTKFILRENVNYSIHAGKTLRRRQMGGRARGEAIRAIKKAAAENGSAAGSELVILKMNLARASKQGSPEEL